MPDIEALDYLHSYTVECECPPLINTHNIKFKNFILKVVLKSKQESKQTSKQTYKQYYPAKDVVHAYISSCCLCVSNT